MRLELRIRRTLTIRRRLRAGPQRGGAHKLFHRFSTTSAEARAASSVCSPGSGMRPGALAEGCRADRRGRQLVLPRRKRCRLALVLRDRMAPAAPVDAQVLPPRPWRPSCPTPNLRIHDDIPWTQTPPNPAVGPLRTHVRSPASPIRAIGFHKTATLRDFGRSVAILLGNLVPSWRSSGQTAGT